MASSVSAHRGQMRFNSVSRTRGEKREIHFLLHKPGQEWKYNPGVPSVFSHIQIRSSFPPTHIHIHIVYSHPRLCTRMHALTDSAGRTE